MKFEKMKKKFYLLKELFRPGNFSYSKYGVFLKKRFFDKTFEYCLLGSYDSHISDYIQNTDCEVFVDIGANQGIFSLIASKNKNIEKIYSFEPNKNILSDFKENIKKNKCSNIEVFPFGLGLKKETLSLFFNREFSGRASLKKKNLSLLEEGYDEVLEIEIIGSKEFDNIFADLGSSKILIKIDVEGYEKEVLEMLSQTNTIKNCVSIFFEYEKRFSDLEDLQKLLERMNFNLARYYEAGEGHGDFLYIKDGSKINLLA